MMALSIIVSPLMAFAQTNDDGGPLFNQGRGNGYGNNNVTLCYQESTRTVNARQAARLFALGATPGVCAPHGTLVLTKTTVGGNGTFGFWTHNGNLADFNVTTTNGTGQIVLSLAKGTYDINEYTKRGWTMTSSTCTSITITSNATTTCAVVNEVKKGSIAGTVFFDRNGDGRGFRNPGNRTAGVTVYLDLNNNAALDTGEPTNVTNALGNYRFTNLIPGIYRVREVVPAGQRQSFPRSRVHVENVSAGENVTRDDFANYIPGRNGRFFDRFFDNDDAYEFGDDDN
jgi:hypothetical protein